MKRIFMLTFAATLSAALFGGCIYAVLVAARVAQPAAATVPGLTPMRLWATATAGLALVGVVVGGLALRRSVGRLPAGQGRTGARMALLVGTLAVISGALNLANAKGGPGTGNGVVGAAAALVLGLIATILGGAVLARLRRRAN